MTAFNVNGKRVSVTAEPETPLLWAIREHLKLTGTKFGCGAGLCGACTVHLNGEAVRSRSTAAPSSSRRWRGATSKAASSMGSRAS